MLTLRARVKKGRWVVDEPADLPEGTELELLPVLPDDFGPEERAALEASLGRALAQVDRGEVIDGEKFLASFGSGRR